MREEIQAIREARSKLRSSGSQCSSGHPSLTANSSVDLNSTTSSGGEAGGGEAGGGEAGGGEAGGEEVEPGGEEPGGGEPGGDGDSC